MENSNEAEEEIEVMKVRELLSDCVAVVNIWAFGAVAAESMTSASLARSLENCQGVLQKNGRQVMS